MQKINFRKLPNSEIKTPEQQKYKQEISLVSKEEPDVFQALFNKIKI